MERSNHFNWRFVLRDLTDHSTLPLVEFSLLIDCKGTYGGIEHGLQAICRGFMFNRDAYLCSYFLPWHKKGRRPA